MKRFTDTCIWNEDWFLDAPTEFQLFWFYVKDNCNHAGIWRVNKKQFEFILGKKISLTDFLNKVNSDKERISVLASGKWYLTGFVSFQYGNILNENNRVHESIIKMLKCYNIDISTFEVKLRSILPQKGVKLTRKDKDKEKDKDNKKETTKIEVTKTWRNDFETYIENCKKGFREALEDKEFMSKLKEFHNNLDVIKSMEKSFLSFWGTKTGWKNKKDSKSEELDWKATIMNTLIKNPVYLDANGKRKSTEQDWSRYNDKP
jgi:hypothetical protein